MNADTLGWELESIGLYCDPADVLEKFSDVIETAVATTREVKITGWAVYLFTPHREQHRSLEEKLVGIRRAAQPVEETFQAESGQRELEVLVSGASEVEQPLADGCREVLQAALAHVSDSR